MQGLQNGMLVEHASLGLGKVVAVEPSAVHVFFAKQDARFATKLRLPMALSFLAQPSRKDAWLSGLSGFALDEGTGRYGRPAAWLPHADALQRFTDAFPRAFSDPAYVAPERGSRAARWRQAGVEFQELLGEGRGERLLEAGDVSTIVEHLLKIERGVRTLLRDEERTNLAERLKDPEATETYLTALFAFVSSARPIRSRFEALAVAAAALPPGEFPESAWPTVTLIPFLARPDLHMLLCPHLACDAAQRLGLDLSYEAEPNWTTYASLLNASAQQLERLRPLGANDHLDVEVFMQVSLRRPGRAKVAAPAGLAAAGAKRGPKPAGAKVIALKAAPEKAPPMKTAPAKPAAKAAAAKSKRRN